MNKLDIEFEDDEEIKAREEAERKKNQVVEEVDIDFGVDDSAPASSGESKPAPKAEKAAPREQQQKVKPVEKAQRSEEQTPAPRQQSPQPAQAQQYQQIPQAQVMIGPDYKLGDELKKFAASNQIFAIELEARVKVEVTKEMTKTVADFHAQNKLLEHKINKLLMQMNQKAPAIKNELMMIKKLLKEHCSLDEEGAEENAAPTKSDGARPTKRPVKKKAA